MQRPCWRLSRLCSVPLARGACCGRRTSALAAGVFFNAFYDQLGSRVIPGPTFLAVLALEAMADRQAEFAPFVPDGEEVSEARAALREVPAFHDLDVVEGLTPFQCVVLDKFEGVITGDLYESRRYADDNDIQVLLEPSGLEVLVLESNDVLASGVEHRSRLYPSHERADAGRAAELLEAGVLDMVFVRYELGAYWHYASVEFDGGSPWHLDGVKRAALEERYLASGVCEAVRAGNADVARMLVLSALLGRGTLTSA